MIYVLSDIHGQRRRFNSIMKQIDLQPEDTLYVLGDVIDRNPDGIKILRQLMAMPNAKLLLGNHELILNDYNGDLVNLFRTIQSNKKLVFLLGRLYLSINSELVFRQNKERLRNIPNVLDDVLDTSQIISKLKWSEVEAAAAFFENQVYSFSSTGQTFGIARRDMSQRLDRLISSVFSAIPFNKRSVGCAFLSQGVCTFNYSYSFFCFKS